MTDTTINRFVGYGTTAQMNAFTPSPPTPASGPANGYLWANSTTDTVWMYSFGTSAWVDTGSSGGGGVTTLGMPPPFNPTIASNLATGYFFGRTIVAAEAISVSKVVAAVQSSAPTAQIQPCLYAFNLATGAWGSLLETGSPVTGAVAGIQAFPFTAPVALTKNALYMFGFIVGTAAFSMCATANPEAVQYMTATIGSAPNPATGVSDVGRQWGSFWLET